MRTAITFVAYLYFLLFAPVLFAQKLPVCAQCNMYIRNARFEATVNLGPQILHFDAIECLVGYLEAHKDQSPDHLQVTDFNSSKKLPAEAAHYLMSPATKSPMGAGLSAHTTEQEARQIQEEKGGSLYTWGLLRAFYRDRQVNRMEHEGHDHHRPDAFAPAGIMGDHLHPKGGFMASLSSMYMSMEGNRDGSRNIPDEDVYVHYNVAPQQMDMYMYMLGIMYAPSEKVTFTLMQQYIEKSMDLGTRMAMGSGMTMAQNFITSSGGLGDMRLGVLVGLFNRPKMNSHLNLGVSLPLGGTKYRDNTPMMDNSKLPYAMQLGSGTFDALLGFTLRGQGNSFSWGLQQINTLRTGTNSEGYRLGNLYEFHTWGAYKIAHNLSTSIRATASTEGSIKGSDPELMPGMVPTADPLNYGGSQVYAALGLNLLLFRDKLALGAEAGRPVYQDYNGIFMERGFSVNTSVKYLIF